jgi:hypothetical protein
VSKFRKKPIVIEAFRLTEDARRSNLDWPQWAREAWMKTHDEPGSLWPVDWDCQPSSEVSALAITTLEGVMKADIGDWIIKGVKGELYPCKPDIFEATYEIV